MRREHYVSRRIFCIGLLCVELLFQAMWILIVGIWE